MSGLVTLRKIPLGPPEELQPRPRLRSECKDGPRPCPWLGCRHHLGNDEHDGIVRVDVSRLSNAALPTCSLDVAEGKIEGVPQILDVEQIAGITGLWHTNVEEALASAEEKLRNDPALAEAWMEIVQRQNGHPLAIAQQWAPETDAEAAVGRPMGKERNGG